MTPSRRKPGQGSGISIDLAVEAGSWPTVSKLQGIVRQAVDAAMEAVRPSLAPASELSILFTDDAHVRKLNRHFRKKDKATNVLSFPAVVQTPGRVGPLLGDIVLASETVAREAEAGDLTLEDHLTHLVVHGFLHLLGHDHEDDSEAAVMEGLEAAILGRLGIADPYAGAGGA